MAKPTDFFVGITDLFSVILPGACIAFVGVKGVEYLSPGIVDRLHLSTNEGYVAFFVVAYLLGHLMDFGGSLLWDTVYDRVYARTRRRAVADRKAKEAAKKVPPTDGLKQEKTIKPDAAKEGVVAGDPLLTEATRLAKSSMPDGDRVFQWSRSWVCLRNPAAFIEIERMQANSKFFRGLVSVFLITGIVLLDPARLTEHHVWAAKACFLLAATSFLRFCDLRWKAVQQTYRFFIALSALPGATAASAGSDKDDDDDDDD